MELQKQRERDKGIFFSPLFTSFIIDVGINNRN